MLAGGGTTSGEMLQNSAFAQGYLSQQQLKGIGSSMAQMGGVGMTVNVHKSPSSYMSEDSAPAHMVLEQKKVRFYAQIEQIKDTQLIENLASLKQKSEKQKCIDSFAEIYDTMMKNVLEISEVVKQIRFQEPIPSVVKTGTMISNASGQMNPPPTGSTQHPPAASSVLPPAENGGKTINGNNMTQGEQKVQIEIADLPDQIIKDCKSIHNIYADLVQDSSLKHLDLCCEIFALDGSAINLKFKISSWYADIKDHVERHRPATSINKNANKKGSSSKSFCSLLCPCFGSKSKSIVNSSQQQQQQQQVINRAYTAQAIQNQRTTLEPPN